MSVRPLEGFLAVRSEGGLLPADLLHRIVAGHKEVEGLDPERDYHLAGGERLNEAVSRSWQRLLGAWRNFRAAASFLEPGDPATTLTRERWLLVLFQELGYGRLATSKAISIEGREYPISHMWQRVPIHLVGCQVEIDKRTPGVAGAARTTPHGLVQDFLNRSPDHLWGFVSNGLRLRILRDNARLTRQAFVEFDLETILETELYADFGLLWLLCHESRVEQDRPEAYWLERWRESAATQGARALGTLRDGVEAALSALGRGFLAHTANLALKGALRTGSLSTQDYYRELLRLVYRLLFLFVAEDRDVLHPRDAAVTARQRYLSHYSSRRLRELAQRMRGSGHGDLFRMFQVVVAGLSADEGCATLGLPALGGLLWSGQAAPHLDYVELANRDWLEVVRALAYTRQDGVLRPVDWRNLGSTELGSVYESLLELHPDVNTDAGTFSLSSRVGSERKTSGSYYTPDSLVQCLLDSALEPVLAGAAAQPDPEQAILALRVCDPACGSGHFLIAAAHRVARQLGRVRTGDDEPAPDATRTALRDVVGHCLYGVDLNPMAAELCKVNLWLEALEPGKPLSFLDHHIRVGNSLLGTTPELIAAGLPDETFTPIEGDDNRACVVLKRQNRAERNGLGPLFAEQEAESQTRLLRAAAALEELPDNRPEHIRAKELAFRHHEETEEYRQKKCLADAWCTAFVIKKEFREPGRDASASGITQEHLNHLAAGQALPADLAAEIERLSGQYQFFHWHLAFPEVSARGGFDCVFGNPPWERTSFEEIPFFEARNPAIASAPTTLGRRRLIAELVNTKDPLYVEYLLARRANDAEQHLVTASGRFPLTAVARVDTYALFTELAVSLVSPFGQVGLLVPTGIATSIPLQGFWKLLFKEGRVKSLSDFENRAQYFPGVDSRKKFCLLTIGGSKLGFAVTQFGFFIPEATTLGIRRSSFPIAPADMERINPLTGQPPVVPSLRDLQLLVHIHRHAGSNKESTPGWVGYTSAGTGGSWISAREILDAGPAGNGDVVALIEGKMVHQFDHRFATYDGCSHEAVDKGQPALSQDRHRDPLFLAQPRFYVPREAAQAFRARKTGYSAVVPVYRDYTSASNERTLIATLLTSGVPMQPLNGFSCTSAADALMAVARLNALAIDYVARLKTPDIHLNVTIFNQLPGPPIALDRSDRRDWYGYISLRSLELVFTSWDMASFAQDCGWSGPPFRWDDERRFLLRCELDAAFFHLYLPAGKSGDWWSPEGETGDELALLKASFPSPRNAVAYIMDTFPIVRRKDEERYGEYRTKRVILEIYDEMQQAMDTGRPFHTRLDPPPADPRVAHPADSARPGYQYEVQAPKLRKVAEGDGQ